MKRQRRDYRKVAIRQRVALAVSILCLFLFVMGFASAKPAKAHEQMAVNVTRTLDPDIRCEVKKAEKESVSLDIPEAATGAKRYMDYRTITARASDQWKLQQGAWTDADGCRRLGNDYMVAMGTFYAGDRCGRRYQVEFEDGDTISCIIADIKQDIHTDEKNQHREGNVVEFIVDSNAINENCRLMGDMSWADNANLHGKPVSIVPIENSEN